MVSPGSELWTLASFPSYNTISQSWPKLQNKNKDLIKFTSIRENFVNLKKNKKSFLGQFGEILCSLKIINKIIFQGVN